MPRSRSRADPADPDAALEAGLRLLVRREHSALELARKEIKISVVVDEKYLELAVRALHDAFELEQEPVGQQEDG